jgi:methyl-accepting chemotaxis protein
MGLITRANREHSAAGEGVLRSLLEVRAVADQNVRGVQESRLTTDGLRERVRGLAAIADRLGKPARRTGGRR